MNLCGRIIMYICTKIYLCKKGYLMKRKIGKRGIAFIIAFIVFALSVVFVSIAASYTEKGSGITWSYNVNSSDMTATITGVTLSKQTKEFNIPSTVTDGENTYTVTAIAQNAFSSSSVQKLVFGKLTIPDTVTSIGSGAFANTYIYDTVVIPESVTYIGSSAFENCDGIVEVVLPSTITVIENNTFKNCFALSKINLEHIKTFKNGCFYDCMALHYIEFGKNTTSIEQNAFYNCDALGGTIDISMVTSIGTNAFYNCDRIEAFVIPDIAHNMNAYNTCPNIEAYYTTENNVSYLSIDGVLHSKDGKTLLVYPATRKDATLNISNTVATIGKRAFDGSKYLKTIVISDSVTKLEDEAFAGSSITTVYVPDNIRVVSFDTFKDCKNLVWAVFGQGVEVIGSGTFTGASALELVIVKNDMATLPASNGGSYYASEYDCVNHIYGYLDKAPNCNEYGYNRCIICDRYEFIPQTNHSGAILEQAGVSCTSDGYRIVECFTCDETVRVVTEQAWGHVSNGKVYTVTAGYKSPAFQYSTCSVCNEMYVCSYTANFTIIGDVNCDGTVNYHDLAALVAYCNKESDAEISTSNADIVRDGAVNQKDIDFLANYLAGGDVELPTNNFVCTNHGRKTTIEIIKPSCYENGFRIRYCSNCGLLTDEISSPKLSHDLVNTFTINSTCEMSGQSISDCTICNQKIYETLEKLPHDRNWYTVAGQRGYEYSTCKICGTLESGTVDYSVFDALIAQIPQYYDKYFQPETLALIAPVLENYKLSLTQAEVDDNVKILSDALKNAQYKVYDVPVVFINAEKLATTYSPATIIVASTDEKGVTHVEAMEYNGEVKIRGRSSAGHSKTPYNFKFTTKVDLFGMGAGKKYCLLSNQNDATLLKNALMFELSDLLGIENSCKYEVVDLYTNGTYRGSYLLTTPVDVGEDRVDIDEDYDYLLEVEYSPLVADTNKSYFIHSPIFDFKFLVNSPEIEDMNAESLSLLRTYVAHIDFAIKSGDWELIQKYVDVDSVAKYYILHELMKEIDIVWDSTRFYIKDGKLYGGPGWDFDLSMENTGGGSTDENNAYNNRNGIICEGGVANDSATGVWASLGWKSDRNMTIWFRELYTYSPEFVKLVCQYVADFNDELSLLYTDQLDERGNVVRQNIIDSIILDDDIAASHKRNRDNKISGSVTKIEYDKKVKALRDWLQRRNEWMQDFYAYKLETIK